MKRPDPLVPCGFALIAITLCALPAGHVPTPPHTATAPTTAGVRR